MSKRKRRQLNSSLDQGLNNNVAAKVNVKQEVKTEPLDVFVPKTENLNNDNNFDTKITVKQESKLVPNSEHAYGITLDQSKRLYEPETVLEEIVYEYNNVIDENLYCICCQVAFGDMIACANADCANGEWFHLECVGFSPQVKLAGKWYCPFCTNDFPAKTEERIVPKKEFVHEYPQYDLNGEPLYCVCNQVSYGDMIVCANYDCLGGEWFHCHCVGINPETICPTKWYCPTCRNLPLPH